MERIELRRHEGAARCPLCHQPLFPGERAISCPVCGTAHHLECARELSAVCGIHGCGRVIQAPPRGEVEVQPARWIDPGPRVGSRRACFRCGAWYLVEATNRYSAFCRRCYRLKVGVFLGLIGILYLLVYLACAS